MLNLLIRRRTAGPACLLGLFLLVSGCSHRPAFVPNPIGPDASGPLSISLLPQSPKSLDKVRINIVDTGPPAASEKVDVALSMLTMDMGNHTVHAVPDGPGKYHADVQFTMPGKWQVTATVQRPNLVYDYTSNVTVE